MGLPVQCRVVNMREKKVGEVWAFDTERIDRVTLWGNPFIMGINGNRDTVCDSYLDWLFQWIEYEREIEMIVQNKVFNNKLVVENLSQLRGKNLACWCSPLRCHGDTLLRLANVS